ncbi:hypothetical protein BU16DRAFT_544312 [Lophium mytilinum]|uniref:Uncharacterized protein n=1 Tax=Lophium mytilinum TaxID=390894 RepID=A0A6A6QD05_9PEZI|nr:hypothetical protein BU16DRAFT_544312 [Lophium mytilinum]
MPKSYYLCRLPSRVWVGRRASRGPFPHTYHRLTYNRLSENAASPLELSNLFLNQYLTYPGSLFQFEGTISYLHWLRGANPAVAPGDDKLDEWLYSYAAAYVPDRKAARDKPVPYTIWRGQDNGQEMKELFDDDMRADTAVITPDRLEMVVRHRVVYQPVDALAYSKYEHGNVKDCAVQISFVMSTCSTVYQAAKPCKGDAVVVHIDIPACAPGLSRQALVARQNVSFRDWSLRPLRRPVGQPADAPGHAPVLGLNNEDEFQSQVLRDFRFLEVWTLYRDQCLWGNRGSVTKGWHVDRLVQEVEKELGLGARSRFYSAQDGSTLRDREDWDLFCVLKLYSTLVQPGAPLHSLSTQNRLDHIDGVLRIVRGLRYKYNTSRRGRMARFIEGIRPSLEYPAKSEAILGRTASGNATPTLGPNNTTISDITGFFDRDSFVDSGNQYEFHAEKPGPKRRSATRSKVEDYRAKELIGETEDELRFAIDRLRATLDPAVDAIFKGILKLTGQTRNDQQQY